MKALIVGSSIVDKDQLLLEEKRADLTLSCDGALHYFEESALKPHIILGDFDSYEGEIPEDAILYEKEKDFSDLEAALLICQKKGIKKVCILGVTGKRQDHFLIALMGLFQLEMDVVIKDPHNKIFVKKEGFTLVDEGYKYFSLIPLDSLVLSIEGAKYDLKQKKVSPGGSVTLSNEFKEREVRVSFTKGRMIVVLSDDNKKTL